MIQIGTKVVCVHGFEPYRQLGYKDELPIRGEIYTVSEVNETNFEGTCIRLFEIVNQPRQFCEGLQSVQFGIKHFREVDYSFGEFVAEIFDREEKLKMNPQPY
jgi:hypothetical protein